MKISVKIISWLKFSSRLLKVFLWEECKLAFLIYVSLFLNVVCWGIFFWLFKIEQSFVILHYNAFLGIDMVANLEEGRNRLEIYFAPMAGFLFLIFNFMLALLLGFFADPALLSERKKERSLIFPKKNEGCDWLDPGMLAIFLVLSGGLVLQLAILLYAVSTFLVNR